MADEESDTELSCRSTFSATIGTLRKRFHELQGVVIKENKASPIQSSAQYCQDFCRTLLEYAGCWPLEADPGPLVEVYTAALLSYSQASQHLSLQCENVQLVLERLSLSFIELLLSLKEELPAGIWEEVKSSVQRADAQLQENGLPQLSLLGALTQQTGVWTNPILQGLLSQENQQKELVEEFLALEGPVLLEMRVKHLMKEGHLKRAALLAQTCADCPAFQGRGHFRQTHLVCLCASLDSHQLMEELSKVDCRDVLEMICNLESEGEERAAFSLCSAFLTQQVLQGDTYCAWELTLFWSKLLKRLESSEQAFLDQCRKMSILSKTVFHILFLIKVIQSEMDSAGLPTCIEMCIRALQMESSDGNSKATICKTLSCLLPNDLEVKRACQLTEFLLEPTVDAYYAVETLYNEPDQKLDEESMPVPNSLRCELLLVFKTQWPFDPEFWDWRTLKRQCLALMGEEASIVSSIDLLNDNEGLQAPAEEEAEEDFRDVTDCFVDATNELNEITEKRRKIRETKKLRQKGFISARFRNWQVYMQYCVLCDKEFLGHRIVRHAQTHLKNGLYSCPICAETFTSKDCLIPHVASHVKQSCNERLTAIKTSKKLANPKTAAPVIAALKAKSENLLQTKPNEDSQGQSAWLTHAAQAKCIGVQAENIEKNVCPVASCRKGFKFLKNLLAHVKAHGENEEARRFLEMQSNKVVCQYCRRQFLSVTHLNDHLQAHCGVNPYICIQLNCKASFQSNTELLVHRKGHTVFRARCMFPRCGKIFNNAFKLYDHESQHYTTFTCTITDCGKIFHSQAQLDLHQDIHAAHRAPSPEDQSSRKPDPGPSLIERMLSDPPSSSLEVSQESKDFTCGIIGSSWQPVSGFMANPLERVAPSQEPLQDFGQYVVKSECQDTPLPSVSVTQVLHTAVIQSSMNSHFTDPSSLINRPDTNSFDNLRAAPLDQVIPPFEVTSEGIDLSNTCHADVLECPSQMFSATESVESMMYTSDCNVSYPRQFQPTNDMLLSGPSGKCISQGMTQSLPPSVTPLPPSGSSHDNVSLYPRPPAAPPAEQAQRHQCAFESCTKNYSCYKSAAKHMRSTHPEFYAQLKLARKNARRPQATLSVLSVGHSHLVPPYQKTESEAVPIDEAQRRGVNQPLPAVPIDEAQRRGINQPLPAVPIHEPQRRGVNQPLPAVPIDEAQRRGVNQPLPAVPIHEPQRRGVNQPLPAVPIHGPQRRCVNQPLPAVPIHEPQRRGVNQPLPAVPIDDAQRQGVNQPLTYPNMDPTSCYASQPTQNLNLPMDMETILNPIVISQLLKSANSDPSMQSQVATTPQWHMPSRNPQISPKVYPSNMQAIPQMGPTSGGLELGASMQPPLIQNVSQNGSYMDSTKVRSPQIGNPLQSLTSLNQNNSNHTPLELTKTIQAHKMQLNFLSSSSACQQSSNGQFQNMETASGSSLDSQKKVKRKLKWPTIFRDGKFICCRCFRQFNSSKSLGSHFSRRPFCKPLSETELAADLPTSFLDLLNSEPQPLHNPSAAYQESPCPSQSVGSDATEPKAFPAPTFPPGNLLAVGNEGSQDDILKQIMAETNITELFEQTSVPQPFFQSAYGRAERLPENSVIHHTGDLRMKKEDQLYTGPYNHSCVPPFASTNFPDPVLSQILSENHHTGLPQSLPIDHVTSDRTTNQTADIVSNSVKQLLPASNLHSPASAVGKQGKTRRRSEQDVKKRLREQILSGDFMQRSNASHSVNIKVSANVKSPASFNTTCNISNTTALHQIPPESRQVAPTNSTIPTSFSSGCQGAVSGGEFLTGFSESTSLQEGIPTTSNMAQPAGTAPFSGVQKPWGVDACAFGRLDSVRETAGNTQPSIKHDCRNDVQIKMDSTEVDLDACDSSAFIKPFACESENCTFRCMSTDALWKHLVKVHNYTLEMVNEAKQRNSKYAPFRCQKCNKTFTRNSNRRAHYQTVHQLSLEEIGKLHLKWDLTRAIPSSDENQPVCGLTQTQVAQTSTASGPRCGLTQTQVAQTSTASGPRCGLTQTQVAQTSTASGPRCGLTQTQVAQTSTASGPRCGLTQTQVAQTSTASGPRCGLTQTQVAQTSTASGPRCGLSQTQVAQTSTASGPRCGLSQTQVAQTSTASGPRCGLSQTQVAQTSTASGPRCGLTQTQVAQTSTASGPGCGLTQTQVAQTSTASYSSTDKNTHQMHNCLPQPVGQLDNKDAIQQNTYNDSHFTQVHPLQSAHMHNLKQPPVAMTQAPSQAMLPPPVVPASNWSNGQHRTVSTMPTQYLADGEARAHLPSSQVPPPLLPSAPMKASVPMPLDKSQITNDSLAMVNVERPIIETPKKTKEKKLESNPYRPYRCVHEGCAAAFTIQHNLILHYRAVHQTALSVLEVNKEQDGGESADQPMEPEEEEDSGSPGIAEFRCQEKDCCRVFQEVPSLLQHYLQLHEFSLDKAGGILSNINLGRFACGQQDCAAVFTAFWKYVGHIKEMHGDVPLARCEQLNGMFRCDMEGCDRVYATKSNLLRHTMKKHHDTNQLKLTNQQITEECVKQNSKNSHYQIVKANNGKENIEGNKKLLQKVTEKRKKAEKAQNNHWSKYGKPSLKNKEEASALCTKKFSLQYPCMITGCESVMRSERSIMKHYMGHGLSERYLEEQRSHFIFCKKFSRYKYRLSRSDDSKSENSSDLSDTDFMADTSAGDCKYGSSKPVLRKRVVTEISSCLFEGKLPHSDSSSAAMSDGSVIIKRKRGRPRKLIGNMVKRKIIPRSTRTRIVYQGGSETDSCDSSSFVTMDTDKTEQQNTPLSTFKPMGFEVSFLKFIEQSHQTQSTYFNGNVGASGTTRKKSSSHPHAIETCIEFSNRQNLKSLNNVKIIVEGHYSFVKDVLLRQLQDMRPTVVLEKND